MKLAADNLNGVDLSRSSIKLETIYLQATELCCEVRALPESAEIEIIEQDKCLRYYENYNSMTDFLWWKKRMYSQAQRDALINDDLEMFLLKIDGRQAGFAFISFAEDSLSCLDLFAMNAEFRGQGLGRSWLAYAMMRGLFGRGSRPLELDTCNLDHPAALKLYKSCGFSETKRETTEVANPLTFDPILQKSWHKT